jgi:hypothetical protein
MRRVTIARFDAGTGPRSAARALNDRIRRRRIQSRENRAVFENIDLLDKILAHRTTVYAPAHRLDREVSYDRA